MHIQSFLFSLRHGIKVFLRTKFRIRIGADGVIGAFGPWPCNKLVESFTFKKKLQMANENEKKCVCVVVPFQDGVKGKHENCGTLNALALLLPTDKRPHFEFCDLLQINFYLFCLNKNYILIFLMGV